MQDVGDEQFLMLLLMVTAQRHQFERLGGQVGQRRQQRGIDMGPIGAHFVQRRPGDHPPAVAGVPLSLRLVIAVEEKGKTRVVQP